jgi:hypothetical protein
METWAMLLNANRVSVAPEPKSVTLGKVLPKCPDPPKEVHK